MCICIAENLDKLRLNECSRDNVYNSFWLAGLTFFLTFFFIKYILHFFLFLLLHYLILSSELLKKRVYLNIMIEFQYNKFLTVLFSVAAPPFLLALASIQVAPLHLVT